MVLPVSEILNCRGSLNVYLTAMWKCFKVGTLRNQRFEKFHDGVCGAGVESCGGFVEEQNLGRDDQLHADVRALPLASGHSSRQLHAHLRSEQWPYVHELLSSQPKWIAYKILIIYIQYNTIQTRILLLWR